MKLEPENKQFNPFDKMLEIAQRNLEHSAQLNDQLETIEKLIAIVQLQGQRIDILERAQQDSELHKLERDFNKLVEEFARRG